MPEAKKIDQDIGWRKIPFVVLSAIALLLTAWLLENYKTGDLLILAGCFVSIVALIIAIFVINRKVFVLLQKLGDS